MKRTINFQTLCLAAGILMFGCSKTNITSEPNRTPTANAKLKVDTYSQQCNNGQTLTVGASYKLNNNIWGAGTNGAGTQCVWYDSTSGQWGCNASHVSGTAQNIKGYPALVRGWIWYNSSGSIWASSTDTSFPVQMSHLQTCTSNWTMTVPTNGEKYDSAYDIWLDTQSNPNYKAQYEVMVWLNYKGRPITAATLPLSAPR